MEPFSSKTVGGREMVIIVFVRDCLIMNHGTILERGAAREMVITVFDRGCLIMNHGTIVQQNSRGRHVMSFAVSVRICLIMNH